MTQEEKQLLLQDLCARLPYGFTLYRESDDCIITIEPDDISTFAHFLEYSGSEDFKPYLRPMSSMTEEERKDMSVTIQKDRIEPWGEIKNIGVDNLLLCACRQSTNLQDWLNKKHFDYRGLIPMGLALETPEGMYIFKN